MLLDWIKRKKQVKAALDAGDAKYTQLKSLICPFFKEGDYSACVKCKVDDYDLDQCAEYYLDRIDLLQIDQYLPKFDLPISTARDKKKLEDLQEIGMTCNSCYMSEKCPEYQKHAACGIEWGEIPASSVDKLDAIINMQYQRIQRASTFELVDGGVPDTNLSVEMDRLTNILNLKDGWGRDKLSISVEASGGATKAGGGLLASIFGGAMKPQEALPAKNEDITYIEVPAEKAEPVKIPTTQPEFKPDDLSTLDRITYEKNKAKMPPPSRKKNPQK